MEKLFRRVCDRRKGSSPSSDLLALLAQKNQEIMMKSQKIALLESELMVHKAMVEMIIQNEKTGSRHDW